MCRATPIRVRYDAFAQIVNKEPKNPHRISTLDASENGHWAMTD